VLKIFCLKKLKKNIELKIVSVKKIENYGLKILTVKILKIVLKILALKNSKNVY